MKSVKEMLIYWHPAKNQDAKAKRGCAFAYKINSLRC